MNIIAWIVLGGVAGWLASIIAGNSKEQGIFGNIIVGIIGAFIGGGLVSLLGGEGITGFNLWSLLVAMGGAVLLLLILRAFRGSKQDIGTTKKRPLMGRFFVVLTFGACACLDQARAFADAGSLVSLPEARRSR